MLETRGVGQDVVLVHGVLGDYRQWKSIGGALGRSHRVIAVSRRFHWPNRGPAADVPYTYEAQAADLDRLLQSLGRPAHLVGHSYGAGVALLAALDHPALVKSLILIEPPFGSLVPVSAPELPAEEASRNSMVAALRASVEAGAPERASEGLIDWVQGGPGGFRSLPREDQEQMLENSGTVGPTFAASAPQVTGEHVSRLHVPVLVLRGERTRPWYRLIAQGAAECIPGAQIGVIPNTGHMAILENPSATAQLVLDFITQHETP